MSSQPEKPGQTENQELPDPKSIRSKSKSDDNSVFLSNPDYSEAEGTKLPETPRNRKASGESVLLNFKPGDEVCFTNIKTGDTQTVSIKWKGIVQAEIHPKRPLMYGIEFKTPIGKHAGRGLFRCRPNHGSLVLPKSLSKIDQTDKPSKRLRHDSNGESRIPSFKKKAEKIVKPAVKSSIQVKTGLKSEKLNVKKPEQKKPEQKKSEPKSREGRPKSGLKKPKSDKKPKSIHKPKSENKQKPENKPKIETPGKSLKLISAKPIPTVDVENEIIAKLNFLDISELKKRNIVSNPNHLIIPTAPKNERKSKSPSRLSPDQTQIDEKENRRSLVFEKQNSETAINMINQKNSNNNFRPNARAPNTENRLRMPRRSRSVPRKVLEKPVFAKSKESQDLEESMMRINLTKSQKRHQIYSSKLFTPDHKYKTDREFATGLPFRRNTPQKKVYRKNKPKNLEVPEIGMQNAN